jgi:four helix bundle protein
MPVKSYRDLVAWQLSMELAEAVYALTKRFPREELFGLTAQLRRSVVGIPSNVSEGHQHTGRAYRHYVVIALGCQAECETQLEIARRLGHASPKTIAEVVALAGRVGRVLQGLARSLTD